MSTVFFVSAVRALISLILSILLLSSSIRMISILKRVFTVYRSHLRPTSRALMIADWTADPSGVIAVIVLTPI